MTKKFTSPSTGEPCTPAALLAEIMMRREADKKKKVLPYKFWNDNKYKKKFVQHVIAANALLKVYDPRAILEALKTKQGSWQWSLRERKLLDIIKERQVEIDKENERLEKETRTFDEKTNTQLRKSFGKKSKMSRLDE